MRIELSPQAVQFYSYQRCRTKGMTHRQVEDFAYEFHGQQYEQFKRFLKRGQRSMDMGCGIGVINIFTSEHFEEIFLVDSTVQKEDLPKTYYGFHGENYRVEKDSDEVKFSPGVDSKYCFYNDLTISSDTVARNTKGKTIHVVDSSELSGLEKGSFDFIQSHMSWGWHYPFCDYSSRILPLLKKGGILIVDIREGSLHEQDLLGLKVLDRLPNRELNSRKYVLEKS